MNALHSTSLKRSKPLKRPESVLVVVHTATQALLLKRVDHACFWQSVTGSLEWGELPAAAAARELEEETGLCGISLRNTGICRSYSILPEWQYRYAANTFRNREHLFFCSLDEKPEIKTDPQEHSDSRWVDIEQAQHEVFSWSNKIALSIIPPTVLPAVLSASPTTAPILAPSTDASSNASTPDLATASELDFFASPHSLSVS